MSKYDINSILSLIPDEDYERINTWRRANLESSRNVHNFMPSRDLLRTWAYEKQNLVQLFGGKLMLSKTVKVERNVTELVREFNDILRYEDEDFLYTLKENLFKTLMDYFDHPAAWEINAIANHIFNQEAILNNEYVGQSITLPANQYKPKGFKITTGCKIMKLLRGLSEYYNNHNVHSLDHIINAQSQVNNSRYVQGELVLSIHPLDFMTMSDNDCNWSSCMSWGESGCYRHGTIEMMNSHNVVIAYLKAKEPMNLAGYDWTNKRWRELFIVDEKIITGVKGYPYRSDELAETVIRWLAELAEYNLGWEYYTDAIFNLKSGGTVCYPYTSSDENAKHIEPYLHFNFITGYMYNDFGCRHLVILGSNYKSFDDYNEISYSGPSQCMCCGETNIDLEPITSEASSITCTHCNDEGQITYCECCGRTLHEDSDEVYWLDDIPYCERCFDDRAYRCVRCGDYHHREDMTPIGLIYDKLDQPKAIKDYICSWCLSMDSEHFGVNHLYKSMADNGETMYFVYDSDRIEKPMRWGNYCAFEFESIEYANGESMEMPDGELEKVY